MPGDWYKHKYVQKHIPAISDVISSIGSFLMVCLVIRGLNNQIASRDNNENVMPIPSFPPTLPPANNFLYFNSNPPVARQMNQLSTFLQSNNDLSLHDINSVAAFEPSLTPSLAPTTRPTRNPTTRPTTRPTTGPTRKPTTRPTAFPTIRPSAPTISPTYKPSGFPTLTRPTAFPTLRPTARPTSRPTFLPTTPTSIPTSEPTNPTGIPTSNPTSPTSLPTGQPTNSPPFIPQYVANQSRFYLNIWVIVEFLTMLVTLRTRYISNWISLPTDTDARYQIQSEGLILKAIQVVLQYFTLVATAGFMGEQLRNDHSLDKPSPFVSNRLCLYVSSVIFWIVLAGGGACYICVRLRREMECFAVLIYVPTVALAGAMQTFFYPYLLIMVMFMQCFYPKSTEKILEERRYAWNNNSLRNLPVVLVMCGGMCCGGLASGLGGVCVGIIYVFSTMGPGILYDGVYVSQLVMPPVLIIMFFSSFAMVTRIAPESVTTVCEPLIGKAGSILLLIVKIIQVCCSIILYLVRIIAHRDMRKVVHLYAELVELHEEYFHLEILKILFSILQDVLNRVEAGNNSEQGRADPQFFATLTRKIEELQEECFQKRLKLASDLVNIWNRLEGYDAEADKGQRKEAIKGVKEIVKDTL